MNARVCLSGKYNIVICNVALFLNYTSYVLLWSSYYFKLFMIYFKCNSFPEFLKRLVLSLLSFGFFFFFVQRNYNYVQLLLRFCLFSQRISYVSFLFLEI